MMVTFSTSFKYFQVVGKEFLAEFIGTFLLVFLGNNAVASSILTNGDGGSSVTIYFGYGFALFLGLLVSGSVSGGHLNPAVTVAGAILKKFPWPKVPLYLLAQYFGAFIASCGTYLVYSDSFEAFHLHQGINKTTASVFATYPKENLTIFGSFIDQIFGSMILLIAIYAATDPHNKIPGYLAPIYISLSLVSIGCSLGINQGFAVNPARDLSPRFFTYISYWGPAAFGSETYWYVTIIGPHIGALLGASIYVFAIEKFRFVKNSSNQSGVASIETFGNKSNLFYCQRPVVTSALLAGDHVERRKQWSFNCSTLSDSQSSKDGH